LAIHTAAPIGFRTKAANEDLEKQEANTVKRIVICADGTWNKPDQIDSGEKRKHQGGETWLRKPSNVVKIARALLPVASDGKTHQIVFYDAGVGTGWGILDPLVGGGFGHGLSKNIIDCYRFLVQNYSDKDEIYLFGFSRGAFTVRSLAGFIGKMGLLPKDKAYWMPEAYAHYRLPVWTEEEIADSIPKWLPASVRDRIAARKRQTSQDNAQAIEKYRALNAVRTVDIKFIGVWDTVGALGIPLGGLIGWLINRKDGFHNVKLGDRVDYAYHALAIDERRAPFVPTLWEKKVRSDQTVEQVWFAGVHTNIGGGYDLDGLANCTYQWMVKRAKLDGQGLEFDQDFVSKYKPNPGGTLRKSMTPIYWLFGSKPRPIGMQENGTESVHWSVERRYRDPPGSDEGGSYKPKNLLAYLEREGRLEKWNT
jgi:uncharacterized protein (DUF2235 family)